MLYWVIIGLILALFIGTRIKFCHFYVIVTMQIHLPACLVWRTIWRNGVLPLHDIGMLDYHVAGLRKEIQSSSKIIIITLIGIIALCFYDLGQQLGLL